MNDLPRRALAEFIGTAFLLMAVVGSGIMAQTLSPTDVGLQLFEAAAATGAALAAIILAVGPVSGAHLNPAVSIADRMLGGLTTTETLAYCGAQTLGGIAGTVLANLMFSEPVVALSGTVRDGGGLALGEVVATFGLLLVIFGMVRAGSTRLIGIAVGAYIAAAYFFTSSTSFANPAVTVARTLTDTFAGIAPGSVLAFLAAELAGTVLAVAAIRVLYPDIEDVADEVLVPHPVSEEVPT